MRQRRRFSPAGLHTLAGAYALNALDPVERIAFERHLARCDACAWEVRGLRETAARLGEAASTAPPPRLRERVIAAARRIPQQGPQARARRIPVPAGWQHWAPRLAAVVALAAIAAAAVAGVTAVGTRHSLDHAEARSGDVAAVLTAHDAHMMRAPVAGGGSATVVMSHSKRMLVVTTRGLPALAGTRRYEVWLMGPAGRRPAGMLPAARRGMTEPMVASGLASGDKLGLTVEPSGGSPRPTTAPILMLAVPA